ncbi:hypothetical protein BDA96_01G126100 [Sorghum bicolor]|uniref:Uncharacterized protein n=1 Tax=Sorghum bicolor TaxID=4558 RepID=A0A921RWR8_SORBI|nr:hypothetical protein BDA96_01G126100 [Sorghum bicolor]
MLRFSVAESARNWIRPQLRRRRSLCWTKINTRRLKVLMPTTSCLHQEDFHPCIGTSGRLIKPLQLAAVFRHSDV